MKFLSKISKSDLEKKTVLLRVDFNVNKNDVDKSWRLQSIFKTVNFLLEHECKIVFMSHLGRPNGVFDAKLSLAFIKPILQNKLNLKINFLNNFDFPEFKKEIYKAEPPSIFLLENLRFLKGEEDNDLELGKSLASMGDIYINDAFGNSHRAHASIVAITNYLPSYAGLVLQDEIMGLNKFLKPKRPWGVIIGGAKISGKIDVIYDLLERADYFLTGGGLANTLLKASGLDVKKSLCDDDKLDFARELLKSKKVIIPIDSEWDNDVILDIGPKTRRKYGEVISSLKTVIWNGPMGYFERPEFAVGSEFIANKIVENNILSVVGGGQTTYLLSKMNLMEKFTFISTGGGAMLEYLAGKKLAGIVALEQG